MYLYIKPSGDHKVLIQHENNISNQLVDILQRLDCRTTKLESTNSTMTVGSDGFSDQSHAVLASVEVILPEGQSPKQIAKAIHQEFGYTFIDKGDYFLITDNPNES